MAAKKKAKKTSPAQSVTRPRAFTEASVYERIFKTIDAAAARLCAEIGSRVAPPSGLAARAIGTNWPDAQGGVYAGIVRGENGAPDHHLIVMGEAPTRLAWQKAVKWAEEQGFSLPKRREQSVLFGNVPELFEKAWYWSGEQYAGDESYAWCQGFNDGSQNDCHENGELRARAVRRLPI